MSRLAFRVRRLEERLGACPGCKNRPALTELVTPSGRRPPRADADLDPCPDCGAEREVISIVLSFDPSALPDAQEGSPPGSLRYEREQAGAS